MPLSFLSAFFDFLLQFHCLISPAVETAGYRCLAPMGHLAAHGVQVLRSRCRRHLTGVASHFNGWYGDDSSSGRAFRYATLAPYWSRTYGTHSPFSRRFPAVETAGYRCLAPTRHLAARGVQVLRSRCRRHLTGVASHFNGWYGDDSSSGRAFRYATLAPCGSRTYGTHSYFPSVSQPLKRLATTVWPLRGIWLRVVSMLEI